MTEIFEVVREDEFAFVQRRADKQIVAAIGKLEAIVLKVLAGQGSRADATQILTAALGRDAETIVARVESRFGAMLRPDRGIAVPLAFDEIGGLDAAPAGGTGFRQYPGPRVLHWCVTRFCPRRCVYCYAEPLLGGRAPDAVLTRDELNAIFAEAVTLGAEHLLVAGSEPFLRHDVPEIMGDALRHGIAPNVTTKHPISADLARRLAAAGVAHIGLSVDSMSPESSRTLIGSETYPRQVRLSAGHLRDAGVEFSIQSVATALNRADLREVARFAADVGARMMQIVPFEPVRRPITSVCNERMTAPDIEYLQGLVAEISDAHPRLKCELFEQLSSGSRAAYNCDIGMTKMFFLPDGVVHRCYKLIDDESLAGSDLRRCSVAAAWHDADFGRKISPARELYRASSCGGCAHFGSCHDNGRCIYQAMFVHQDYYAPDRDCDGPYYAS